MPIAFDNSSMMSGASGSILTMDGFVTGNGSNRLLVVGATSNSQVVSMTYAGNPLTQATFYHDVPNLAYFYLHYLVNPPTGAGSIVAYLNGSPTSNALLQAGSYSGVKQTGTIDNSANIYPASVATAFAQTLTTTADNCWGIFLTRDISGQTKTAGANTFNRQIDNNVYGRVFADTNAPKTPAGSLTMNMSTPVSTEWTSTMITIAPTIDTTKLFTIMGVGT